MSKSINLLVCAVLFLGASATANAEFGVGLKAGTLGLGLEGRWKALPWLDLRVGANQYDYATTGTQAGIEYDTTLAMDNYYLTGNFRFPLSPFRITAGAYSNGNELQMTSQDTNGTTFDIGGVTFSSADIGALQGVTTFDKTSPYVGVGYDFELFGKVGFNLDFGVLWQGEPLVSLYATEFDTAPPEVQAELGPALEAESQEIADEFSNYKAWPVLSFSFVYNF